jgi:hypothetical protein
MLKLLCLAVVFFTFSGLAPSQERIATFAGTWEAKFQGAVFCVIRITGDAQIAGTILAPGSIRLNEQGALVEAEPSRSGEPTPLRNARVDGNTLTFDFKDNGDGQTEHLVFTLNSDSKAALQFIDAPMRPITFERK